MRAKRTESIIEVAGVGTAGAGARRAYGGDVGVRTLWRTVWSWLAWRLEVQRQRRDLANLTTRELEDIGLTPAQARRESSKPFWRE